MGLEDLDFLVVLMGLVVLEDLVYLEDLMVR